MEQVTASLQSLWNMPLYRAGDTPVLFHQLLIALFLIVIVFARSVPSRAVP